MLNHLGQWCIRHVRRNAVLKEKVKQVLLSQATFSLRSELSETTPLNIRFTDHTTNRLTLLVPSLNQSHMFGGIATALSFFEGLAEKAGIRKRIICTDTMPDRTVSRQFPGYHIMSWKDEAVDKDVIVGFANRSGRSSVPMGKKDLIMATSWWTAFHAQEMVRRQAALHGQPGPLIYFIQDYEPGFYPWSARYALAQSTYRFELPMIPVFNSSMLYTYFKDKGLDFDAAYVFEPVLNRSLARGLNQPFKSEKKKQILVYGRPSVERNGFPLIIAALRKWVENKENIQGWTLVSAGEKHPDVNLGKGVSLCSAGKLSLSQYQAVLRESALGISLMVSPHPSYPPMEMAMYGMGVISNRYANKDLSQWHENILSIDLSVDNLVMALDRLSATVERDRHGFTKGKLKLGQYMEHKHQFGFMDQMAGNLFWN